MRFDGQAYTGDRPASNEELKSIMQEVNREMRKIGIFEVPIGKPKAKIDSLVIAIGNNHKDLRIFERIVDKIDEIINRLNGL